ncbi:MATE efflux family protein [Striga asiatica]|uniref:MATE efflux family protein n=1 Tax=Striga asiatica TaxID=4170 RepID=A0A5A7P546_STRAF|nr:MATE efflux family protein [Striga asiatica]
MAEEAEMMPPPSTKWKIPIFVFFRDVSHVFKRDELGMEILRIAFPAALALAADPIASLIDTAFIGHLGPVEIAGVGVSIAILNQASKVTIFPLVSITTSFVAEEDTIEKINAQNAENDDELEKGFNKKNGNTKSTTSPDESSSSSSGTKDQVQDNEKKPTCKTVDDSFGIGTKNKAKSESKRRNIPSASTALLLGAILGLFQTLLLILLAKPFLSLLLLARVIAVTTCVTLAASMAARLGPTPMAAFQICLQVWLLSSLLADGLAVAGQAILACAFAEKDYQKAASAAARVLQMGFVLGLGLAVFVGLGLQFGSGIFTSDRNVIHVIAIGIPFVAATQPINSLAFVFDGVNFGASDFAYTAYSMVLVSIVSIGSLFFLSKSNGFVGIWLALTIYMGLRTFAGLWRMGTGTGPWQFLKRRAQSSTLNDI